MSSEPTKAQVVVCGAGPVGLLVTLRLAQAGLSVILLEAGPGLSMASKATHYASPAVKELDKAGVVDEVWERGIIPNTMCWRDIDLNMLGKPLGFSSTKCNPRWRTVAIPQGTLAEIFLERVQKFPNATVLFNHQVSGIDQADDHVTVTAKVLAEDGTTTEKKYVGEYAAGTDGGRSAVRKLIGQHLDGYTWEDQIIATNVQGFDFAAHGMLDSNFIIHPDHMVMFAKMTDKPVEEWRVTYGEVLGLDDEELRVRLPMKFNAFMPGPKPMSEGSYKITNFSPYKIHQRCVAHMRVGRVALAGDAAHLVNPFGGTGLTSGMVDGGGLADCLIGIFQGKVSNPDAILSKYDEERRRVFREFTSPVSTANKARMRQTAEEALTKDDFIKFLANSSDEEKAEAGMGNFAMQVDFTEFYDRA